MTIVTSRPACPPRNWRGESVFGAGKLAFGVPKLLLVENDFDIADQQAFASRSHPEHREVHLANEPQNIIPIYLDSHEHLSYQATKVVYNCLLADRFPADERPVASDFAHNWSPETQQRHGRLAEIRLPLTPSTVFERTESGTPP